MGTAFSRDNLIAGDKPLKTESVLVASGEGALVRGTVLGRVKVSVPTTGAIVGTGNGTCTAVTGGPNTKQGTYVATLIVVVAHGGTFKVVNPDGNLIGTVTILAGAGQTGVFTSNEINFTMTDGSTDFILGDTATITVTEGVPNSVAVVGTGNGTLTSVEGRRDLKIGAYTFTCKTAVAHGGVFGLTDPDGLDLPDITLTPGAGTATAFQNDQIAGILTDGSTDFIVGDTFTITTTIAPRSVKKLSKAATDGSSVPYAILAEAVDATSAAKAAASYIEGEFNQRELVFASGTDIEDVRDAMRDIGMLVRGSVAE